MIRHFISKIKNLCSNCTKISLVRGPKTVDIEAQLSFQLALRLTKSSKELFDKTVCIEMSQNSNIKTKYLWKGVKN